MTGAWIYTQGERSGRWVNISLLGMEDAGGIPTAEWLNVATGSGFLLLPDGKWSSGGRFHLFYKSAGGTGGSKVDNLLAPARPEYRPSPVAWQEVFDRCVDYIHHLVGAEHVVHLDDFAAGWQEDFDARREAERAALSEISVPNLDDVVRKAAEAAQGAKRHLEQMRGKRVEEREAREAAESAAEGGGSTQK